MLDDEASDFVETDDEEEDETLRCDDDKVTVQMEREDENEPRELDRDNPKSVIPLTEILVECKNERRTKIDFSNDRNALSMIRLFS